MSAREDSTESGTAAGQVASWREFFALPGVGAIFLAKALSMAGDYIARLSVAAVVYSWTRSPLATATTLAVSLLPTVLGGSLLSPLVDRFHYRTVLVVSAVVRALLVVALVVAIELAVPLAVILSVLVLLELFGAPAATAGQVLWVELLPDRRHFMRAMSLTALSEQANQAAGLALGGLLIGLVGATTGLVIDVVTFGVLAVVVLAVVRRGTTSPSSSRPRLRVIGSLRDGLGFIAADPVLGRLLALSAISTLAVVAPEALAIPYAGERSSWGGLLMSAPIVGAAVGVLVVSRWAPRVANARMVPMAVLMPVPLLLTAFHPSLPITWLVWCASGALQAFMLPLQSTFTLAIPADRRGTVLGLAAAVSVGASGLSFVAAGWLAEHTTPSAAVTICAVVGLGVLLVIAATWPRRRLASVVDRVYGPGDGDSQAPGSPLPSLPADQRDLRT